MATLSKKRPRKPKAPPTTAEEMIARLTDRQQEILSLIVQGSSNIQIAQALNVTPSTIKSHISRLLSALAVHSRIEAAVLWTEVITRSGSEKNN